MEVEQPQPPAEEAEEVLPELAELRQPAAEVRKQLYAMLLWQPDYLPLFKAEQQQDWMRRKCDQFFCEPNARAGRGTYNCVPLVRRRRLRGSEASPALRWR